MRKLQCIIILVVVFACESAAQQEKCIFKPPYFTIHFGSAGKISDQNEMVPPRYGRVTSYCPSDGHYIYTPYTSDCFRGDWFTLNEDHTAGDQSGNMLLINSSPRSGIFFSTSISGLKSNTIYEFGVWMMNVCRITEKCPFPLLPDITIQIQTAEGKNVSQLSIGELTRVQSPQWTQFQFVFTAPQSDGPLSLIMVNNAPGGCGNDFVMDDITFRECIIPPPPTAKKPTKPAVKKQPSSVRPPAKKVIKPTAKKNVPQRVTKSKSQPLKTAPLKSDSTIDARPPVKPRTFNFPSPPEILKTRSNVLVRRIVTEAGEIRIDLYDNGEIDNDTVSIYHNNRLLASRARLSQQPVTFRITVDESNPHHEFIMVANNLGSIPPNTSLMIVTAGDKRHEVFISSTKQQNAKVVLDLAE